MNKIKDENKFFLGKLIESLHEIADYEYQEKEWVARESNLVDSFEDSITDFLDRCEIVLENHKNYDLNKAKFNALKTIYNLVYTYYFSTASEKKDVDIIGDPKWKTIRISAGKAYKELLS